MKNKKFDLIINRKIPSFQKTIKVDSDKSTSIRFFLISSISQNISSARNILESEDVHSCISCLTKLGVKITKNKKFYRVYGNGLGSLYSKKNASLNFGNSGTLARLIIGILATTPNIELNVKGDHSLNKRSMKSLIKLMSNFGAFFYPKKKYFFPLKLISSNFPVGFKYVAGTSAQLKSAVILAGLNSKGNTNIIEKSSSRDHTENMLLKNKNVIKIKKGSKKIITIYGKNHLDSLKLNVPGDPSSAAFFIALTLLRRDSKILIKDVGLNPTRIGFYNLLKKYGARIKFKNMKKENNEIKGDILAEYCKLKPIFASKDYYVNSTDEYPILFVIAALTKGISVFKGIKDLANKESNRIKEMQKILSQVGVKSFATKDSVKIYGKGLFDASNQNIFVPNLGDHRICMSSFVLSILVGAKTTIKNFNTVFTSSPSFLKTMKLLNAKYQIQK